MFYILVFIGIIFITLGIYIHRGEVEAKEDIALNDLIFRIENLEMALDKEEKPSFEDVATNVYKEVIEEDTELLATSMDNYKRVAQYEKENYSIEEISDLLNMKKGEILLLKNLYKNYES